MNKLTCAPTEIEIQYREMAPADIAVGLRLCRASHWNQLARDWKLFLKLSPHGCRVAVNGVGVVGTVATLQFEDRFSWISMVLVDPMARGFGIGTQLLGEALEILKGSRAIRLDATPAGHAIYRRLNFVDEYRLSRMETAKPKLEATGADNPARPMTQTDLPDVFTLDREVFGADRRIMLEWMLDGAPQYAWVTQRNGRLAGYMFGRPGFTFEHLGPVVAQDQESAQNLVAACLAKCGDNPVILDAPRNAPAWLSWLESLGFAEQRPFIRMFRGENNYPGRPEKQFAILGPEFG